VIFQLDVLALGGWLKELRAPRLLLNRGPSEPCYATAYHPTNSVRALKEPHSSDCKMQQISSSALILSLSTTRLLREGMLLHLCRLSDAAVYCVIKF